MTLCRTITAAVRRQVRRTPLTLLYLTATIVADSWAVAARYNVVWFDYVVAGQLFVTGGWLALGRTHRLARAAATLTVIAVLTLPDYVEPYRYDEKVWRHVLATFLYLTGVAAAGAAFVGGVAWLLSRRRLSSHRSWQMPLRELFAWTLLAALVSMPFPKLKLDHLDAQSSHWVDLGTAAIVAGAMIALLWRATGRRAVIGLIVSIAAIGSYWGGTEWFYPRFGYPESKLPNFWDAYAYVAGWLIVQRIDARITP